MILIGEKLNSSIPSTLEAMKKGEDALLPIITSQAEAGAAYLDINTALLGEEELPMMKKIISLVIAHSDCGLVLDSPNPSVLSEAVKACEDRPVILNSVTVDERIEEVIPTLAEKHCGVILLPIDRKNGIPATAEKRLENAEKAIARLKNAGVPEEKIWVDVIVETLATADDKAKIALDTVALIKSHTKAKSVCGLSNLSFGLPKRAFLNASFLSIANYLGLDAAIADPTSPELRKAFYASSVVCGEDEYCMNYIGFIRKEYL